MSSDMAFYSSIDYKYGNLLHDILYGKQSFKYTDTKRNVECHQVNSYQLAHDMRNGFPLIQTKKVSMKNILVELIWFLRGGNNIQYLIKNGCNIWNKDAYTYYKRLMTYAGLQDDIVSFQEFIEKVTNNSYTNYTKEYECGDLGQVYGKLWRNFEAPIRDSDTAWETEVVEEDQFENLIDNLKKYPMSRRHVITAWNPVYVENVLQAALPPCHWAWEVLPFFNSELDQWEFDLKWHQRSVDAFLG